LNKILKFSLTLLMTTLL